MPTLFPANPIWGDQRTIHYQQNTAFDIPFVTQKAALEPFLPEHISVPDEPTVTVSYCMCRGVREMVGARLQSGQRHRRRRVSRHARPLPRRSVPGHLENKFPPVMIGRELVGYPKLGVDIDNP